MVNILSSTNSLINQFIAEIRDVRFKKTVSGSGETWKGWENYLLMRSARNLNLKPGK